MSAEQTFSMVNLVAMAGWLILIFAGRRRWAAPLVSGAVIPLLLAALYTGLLLVHWRGSQGDSEAWRKLACFSPIHGCCWPDGCITWLSIFLSGVGRCGMRSSITFHACLWLPFWY